MSVNRCIPCPVVADGSTPMERAADAIAACRESTIPEEAWPGHVKAHAELGLAPPGETWRKRPSELVARGGVSS